MRLVSTTLLLAGAASALTLAAQPAAAATALSGDLNIVANASTHSGPTQTSMDSQSWSNVPATLNVTATAVANGGVFLDHNERVSSFGTAQATWASANAGSVDFTNYGWNFSVKDNAPIANGADLDANRPGSGFDWTYAFQATGDGVFQMNYDVTATGSTDGLFGWAIAFTGPSGPTGSGGPDLNAHINDPTTSGVFQANVTAGQFYFVGLAGNPNIGACCARNFAAAMDGTFDWHITERGGVPEPASWALMLVGFGGMGAVLRSRRKLATIAA
jgi:PEP-CTERM motif